jgi:hypothetical protein
VLGERQSGRPSQTLRSAGHDGDATRQIKQFHHLLFYFPHTFPVPYNLHLCSGSAI